MDIHQVIEHFRIDLATRENWELLRNIFDSKRVPLNLLESLREFREFHRLDFDSVKATVKAGVKLQNYDFYFDYVTDLVQRLIPFGHV